MGQGIKTLHKFAHDAEDTPGIGNSKVKVQGAIKSVFLFLDLLRRSRLSRTNQWLHRPVKQAFIFCNCAIVSTLPITSRFAIFTIVVATHFPLLSSLPPRQLFVALRLLY